MEAIFSQNSPQNHILKTSIRHKNSKKGLTFSSKIPEMVDVETIKWHTPCENNMSPPPPSPRDVHPPILYYYIVGSTEVIFKVFVLFSAYSDWLRVNHPASQNKEKEMVFLTFFRARNFCSKIRQIECECSRRETQRE